MSHLPPSLFVMGEAAFSVGEVLPALCSGLLTVQSTQVPLILFAL